VIVATPEGLGDLADSLAGVGGVLGGFLLSAATLLATVLDREFVAKLRSKGHLDYLLIETMSGVVFFVSLALVASLSRAVPDELTVRVMSVSSLFLASLGTYTLAHAGRKYFLLVSLL
jgi:hypothetical protein